MLFISLHEKYGSVISGLLGCHAISRALRCFPFGNQNSGGFRTDAVVVVPTDGVVSSCWKQSAGSLASNSLNCGMKTSLHVTVKLFFLQKRTGLEYGRESDCPKDWVLRVMCSLDDSGPYVYSCFKWQIHWCEVSLIRTFSLSVYTRNAVNKVVKAWLSFGFVQGHQWCTYWSVLMQKNCKIYL